MDTTITTIITLLTPGITGLLKRFIPYKSEKVFKKFLPIIPPLVGALLGLIGDLFGFQITPEINNAFTGLFLGAMGSTGYDAVKAQRKG